MPSANSRSDFTGSLDLLVMIFSVAICLEWSPHLYDAAGFAMPPSDHFTCLFGELDNQIGKIIDYNFDPIWFIPLS